MKIVFRVAYHTRPGQSLWLRLKVSTHDHTTLESWFPMSWLNHRQWQTEIQLESDSPTLIEYHYQFRQEINHLQLDEWNTRRRQAIDPARCTTILLEDTWSCAGTVDSLIAKSGLSSPHASPTQQPTPPQGNHDFFLFMEFLPAGTTPCLMGDAHPLGAWDTSRAIPLQETKPNLWHASVSLPDNSPAEYKYGLIDTATGSFRSYEIGENRIIAPHTIGPSQHTVISDEAFRHLPADLPRASGVAIPVFSLRSAASLGVGEFADLIPFADWAADCGFRLIQILPINDTTSAHDWTDSYPYSAISAFALHPIYLRLEDLSVPLNKTDLKEISDTRPLLNPLPTVDHPAVMACKTRITRRLFQRHRKSLSSRDDIATFIRENHPWLAPYAAFCVLRDRHDSADFARWPAEDRAFSPDIISGLESPTHPDHASYLYHLWLQFELDRQLRQAVAHLHTLGVSLKGDLPIGIDRESADAWSMPHLFQMDRQAGAPPDAFAVNGQNWGFPTYDWETMARDGFAWWNSRLHHLGRYFDAMRIDHILGFFRIWQIPSDQIDGILGWFEPALPLSIEEIRSYGIPFEIPRHTIAHANESTLLDWFGDHLGEVRNTYLAPGAPGTWRLAAPFSTQRKIQHHFLNHPSSHPPGAAESIESGLRKLATEVLFLEAPGSNGSLFHPRCNLHTTRLFTALEPAHQEALKRLHDDYFYRRHENFWQACGYQKLPTLRRQSPMLLCGEDLGMVPDCVPGVMRELGILSLEIQRMPKSAHHHFAHPADAPYLSVVSPGTHDMPPLRSWWEEEPETIHEFVRHCLGLDTAPGSLTPELATRILHQHLASPAMWAIFPFQDLLAIDPTLRHPDPHAERINIPAITPYYWRYRMHLSIEDLRSSTSFARQLRQLLASRTI